MILGGEGARGTHGARVLLTSSPLNVVSRPFRSAALAVLSSVSSTVLTVLVELPSTRPSDETADLVGLVNFFFR